MYAINSFIPLKYNMLESKVSKPAGHTVCTTRITTLLYIKQTQPTILLIAEKPENKHHTQTMMYKLYRQKHSTMNNKHSCFHTHTQQFIMINNNTLLTIYKTVSLMTQNNSSSESTTTVIVTKWNVASNNTSTTRHTATQNDNS